MLDRRVYDALFWEYIITNRDIRTFRLPRTFVNLIKQLIN